MTTTLLRPTVEIRHEPDSPPRVVAEGPTHSRTHRRVPVTIRRIHWGVAYGADNILRSIELKEARLVDPAP